MQGCLREREILAQLKDCETPDTAQEVLKKDEKNKKGAAPNKQVKGTEELLKEELDSIRKMDINGWILVDFPKTLAQTKLLEYALSGFQSKSD